MKLEVGCQLTFDAGWPTPVVLMMSPQTGDGQNVIAEEFFVDPPTEVREYFDSFGNLCQRLVMPEGPTGVVGAGDRGRRPTRSTSTPPHRGREVARASPTGCSSSACPAATARATWCGLLANEITADALPGYPQVEAIRSWINANIRYEYGTSEATTWALDTIESKAGVCRDFAHLGISLCRALQIPARMVVGYLHELDPMDQHAWFEAFVGGRWFTFDATQAEPKGNRVAVAYGRDAADVAIVTQFGPLELHRDGRLRRRSRRRRLDLMPFGVVRDGLHGLEKSEPCVLTSVRSAHTSAQVSTRALPTRRGWWGRTRRRSGGWAASRPAPGSRRRRASAPRRSARSRRP